MLSLDRIAAAPELISPEFLGTPQFVAESLGDVVGVETLVKVETVNPIRSFKGRGTSFLVETLDDGSTPLVCASAGNFGQGLAWAGRRRGIPVHVFAATNANPLKVERMTRFGATVHLDGPDFDAAKDAARAFADGRGLRYIEDGREPAIAEGAGTIAIELLASGTEIDALLVPLGNGALLGGVGLWMKTHSPGTRIIGVCASGAPSMQLSLAAGRAIETARVDTIADGIAVRVPIPAALDYLRDVVDEVVLIDDDQLIRAMQLLHSRLGLVIEPAGAAGVAALIAHRKLAAACRRAATILCGGNVSESQRMEWTLG
ncbi:MAG: threonine ammonia-lyase [Gemmatimonadota bacterium]